MGSSKPEPILEALQVLAEQLGLDVRYESMAGSISGTGGLCRVRGDYRVIIDRRLPARERVQILAAALSRFDLGDVELPELLVPLFPAPTPSALAG